MKSDFNQAAKRLSFTPDASGVEMKSNSPFSSLVGGAVGALAISIAAALASVSSQAAEKCALQKIASVQMVVTPDGNVNVPVIIAGDPLTFGLSINDGFSAISSDYANRRGFHLTSNLPYYLAFKFLDGTATVPDVTLGGLPLENVTFLRGDITEGGIKKIGGTIGLNILENYDVELDFENNRLNLFSQDHCPGNVVYWASSYTTIPFTQDVAGNLAYKLTLDGKPVTAGFDLSRSYGHIKSVTAKRLFGLNSVDGLTKTGKLLYGTSETYKYPFQALGIGAFTFEKPEIDVYSEKSECLPSRYMRCLGSPEIYVGADQLRKLHLFYAFKEGTLYITTADAHL